MVLVFRGSVGMRAPCRRPLIPISVIVAWVRDRPTLFTNNRRGPVERQSVLKKTHIILAHALCKDVSYNYLYPEDRIVIA
jgi:hypothetical protein